MKKIIVLLFISFFAPLDGMRAQLTLNVAQLAAIKHAYAQYMAAIKSLDTQEITEATQNVKKVREEIPWWQRIAYGKSQLSPADQYELSSVFSDSLLLRFFEKRLDGLGWQERQDRDSELYGLRDTIIEKLGYGPYIQARNAYWQLMRASQECNASSVTTAFTEMKKIRKQFSWFQKLGLAYWTEGDCPYYDYKETISSDQALAREVLNQMAHCKDATQAQELISSQTDLPLRVLATRESQRTDGFAGNHFQNPAVLTAFYRLRTPLNNERLLEYARRKNNTVMEQVIHNFNPDLKV